MANRAEEFGLTKEVIQKINEKYDPVVEKLTMNWVNDQLGRKIYDESIGGQDHVHEILKDGHVLCELINKFKPGCIPNVPTGKLPFFQMERIGMFLTCLQSCFGVKATETFQTVDLYEKRNMVSVMFSIQALARSSKNPINLPRNSGTSMF